MFSYYRRAAMDVEAEIRDLKRRVGELEGGFGFLTQQVQAVHRDLLGFQEQTDQRFDKVDARFDKVEAEIRGVKADVTSLRKDLPTIVGDVMREVLGEQKR
jgi:archaellum component FlaC